MAVEQMLFSESYSDEELMLRIADRQQDALKPLYHRYAPLVFHLAAQTLDSAAAEDIVQDVFLSVWHKADTFDPKRGPFRPWLLQIAHFRILNELRRRSRRPQLDGEAETTLQDLPDSNPEPIEAAWETYRREAVRAAVDRLPPPQRQALRMAFFEDLTHDQVADALDLPLGTVKTRIRSGLSTLRANLKPIGIVAVLLGILALVGIRYQMQMEALQREARALVMVTTSDITVIHLAPQPGVGQSVHGSYRGRPGTPIGVIALEKFPPAPAGETFQGWVRYKGVWISLGTITPDANGQGILIGEGPELATPPEAVQVTLEPAGGSAFPTGPAIIAGPNK